MPIICEPMGRRIKHSADLDCGFWPQEKFRSLTFSEMSSICSIMGATSSNSLVGFTPEITEQGRKDLGGRAGGTTTQIANHHYRQRGENCK